MNFVIINVHNRTYSVPLDIVNIYFPGRNPVINLDIPDDYTESFDLIHQIFYNPDIFIDPKKLCKVIQLADYLGLDTIVSSFCNKILKDELIISDIENLCEIPRFRDIIILKRLMKCNKFSEICLEELDVFIKYETSDFPKEKDLFVALKVYQDNGSLITSYGTKIYTNDLIPYDSDFIVSNLFRLYPKHNCIVINNY